MDSASDDSWSDTSEEDENQNSPPLQSRAYQIEMFEHSMKGNIIAVMNTGSGKTIIAKLRIEAELERSPDKLVWFTAPTVVLAYQQYRFLSQQLPAFQFRLITGMDNAEYWTASEIWAKVLHNIHVVVSTPAILGQALNYGFVSLRGISLFVFDEAHHCVGNASLNLIMKHHYHQRNISGAGHELPHILGLSASPITRKRAEEIVTLEQNLNAVCKSPLQQVDEYAAFVNMPEFLTLTHSQIVQPASELHTALTAMVSAVHVEHDPIMMVLRKSNHSQAQEKLEKILKKNCTPAMEELQSLVRSCTDIQQNLGNWACDAFIKKCVRSAELAASRALEFAATETPSTGNHHFIASSLQPLHKNLQITSPDLFIADNISSKVDVLLSFLKKECRPDLRCLIFVKTRPTAWSLAEIINSHPLTQSHYQAFSFVGVSNPTRKGVFDFAELRSQHDNLESFRRGELNLCVATSVLEEGVDVPATNLVICFDLPPNFRSYVQSRGRTRQKNSKFALFLAVSSKLEQWQALEVEMKQECEKSLQSLAERENLERLDQATGEIFRVGSTGATLTFSEARQLLDRFCASLPKMDESERTTPAFLIEGEPGIELRAKVYLPASLPQCLRIAESKSSWRTEKRAKQDAAFQAYRALYKAGLVTDNLLPPQLPEETDEDKTTEEQKGIEKRDSFYKVQAQYDPWPRMVKLWETSDTVYAHCLRVEAPDVDYPDLLLLLPVKLSDLAFPLFTTFCTCLQVTVSGGKEVQDFPVHLAREITLLLLTMILGRRLQGLVKEQLPFLLVPDIDRMSLQAWYEMATTKTPATTFMDKCATNGKSYLVKKDFEIIPYIWQWQTGANSQNSYSDESQSLSPDEQTKNPSAINTVRLSRKLNYLFVPDAAPDTGLDKVKVLGLNECSVLGLPAEYGRLTLLVPSITYMLEVALRSAAACQGPLSAIEFSNIDLVSQALTLPAVGTRNYERLEFLGDSLLKFYASLQIFIDYPNHPEGQLTIYRTRIISNARLQRATRTLGLDQFLTRYPFTGKEWSAGVVDSAYFMKKQPQKSLPSKTLADVVEAIIGAASLSAVSGENAEQKIISALKLLFDEVPWRSLSENMAQIQSPDQDAGLALDLLAPVELMIGYSFRNRGLLAQALTQSSLCSFSSYERFEFLGDVILDYIVSPKLFHSHLRLEPAQMTFRRAAVVSHLTLAFFAQQTSYTRRTFEVLTDPHTKKSTGKEKTETIYLTDYIRRVGNQQAPLERQATVTAHHKVRSSIIESLGSGLKFPWTQLSHLAAPKCFSDIFESILGAVFIDSEGNSGACEAVLEKIGYMSLVRRLVNERDFDTRHPESVLGELLNSQGIPKYKLVSQERKKNGTAGKSWRCKVLADGRKITHVKHASCKDEARCRAAEKAVNVLSMKRKRESTEGEQQEQEQEEGDRIGQRRYG